MWKFHQSTGKLFFNEDFIATGYAGYGQGKNNPKYQNTWEIGPLPIGLYEINPPVQDPKTGFFTLPLTPNSNNEMFGRSNFRIHGDSVQSPGNASHGCIVMPLVIRRQIWNSNNHNLEVII